MIYAEIAPKALKQSSSAQASLSDVIFKSTKYSPSSAQAKDLSRAVTYYLAKDMLCHSPQLISLGLGIWYQN